jgi:integrase
MPPRDKPRSEDNWHPPRTRWKGDRLVYFREWPAKVWKRHPHLKGRHYERALGLSFRKPLRDHAEATKAALRHEIEVYEPRVASLLAESPKERAASWLATLDREQREALVEIANEQLGRDEPRQRVDVRGGEFGEPYLYDPNAPDAALERLTDRMKNAARRLTMPRAPLSQRDRDHMLATVRAISGELERMEFPQEALGDRARELLAQLPNNALTPLTADALLDSYAADNGVSPATRKKYGATFRQIARILGFDDARRITEDDAIRFKEARLKEGRDPGTVQDDILAAGAVCSWAVKNKKLVRNPFEGIAPKAPTKAEPPRAPYNNDEAKCILTAAREETGWLRWAPWILALTGARIAEIAELRRGDVREEAGALIFDLVPTKTRPLKTRDAQRMLPLHPALIAEGFLEYVDALPKDPKGPLFPSVTANAATGVRFENATNDLTRWVRKTVKITDPSKAPAHSWRHRMQDVTCSPECIHSDGESSLLMADG